MTTDSKATAGEEKRDMAIRSCPCGCTWKVKYHGVACPDCGATKDIPMLPDTTRNAIDEMKREGMSDEAIIAKTTRTIPITDVDTLEAVRLYLSSHPL